MVQPVTNGQRRVVVAEIWEGLPRRCPRRCNTPWGPCECPFAPASPTYLNPTSVVKVKPCLRLMSKTADELREAFASDDASIAPAEREQAGAHALWMRRQTLEKQRAAAAKSGSCSRA